jgi:hypothetical protein
MQGHAGRTVQAGTEAERIGAEFGLGTHVKTWRRGSKALEWAIADVVLIGMPATLVLGCIGGVLRPHGSSSADPLEMAAASVWSMAMMALMVVAWRTRYPVLYEFEAGLANVTRYRRRVKSVLRWADLASVHQNSHETEDGKTVYDDYVLSDLKGNEVVGCSRKLACRAEQVLAARRGWPGH